VIYNQDLRSSATWDGIRDASKNGDVCSQYDSLTATLISSEDCFYLNVYIPYDIHGTTNNLVMIWIHDDHLLLA
jgi:carboxylesterase type B